MELYLFNRVFTEILFNKNKGYKYLGCIIVLYIVDLVLAMTFERKIYTEPGPTPG